MVPWERSKTSPRNHTLVEGVLLLPGVNFPTLGQYVVEATPTDALGCVGDPIEGLVEVLAGDGIWLDCSGSCISDINNNGVCDGQEVLGCTYPLAENFDVDATDDDGSCIFPCEGVVNTNVFDWDGDYVVTVTDFLMMLSVYGDTDVDMAFGTAVTNVWTPTPVTMPMTLQSLVPTSMFLEFVEEVVQLMRTRTAFVMMWMTA